MNATLEREQATSADALDSGKRVSRPARVYSPAVDIYEEADAFVAFADIPGAGQSDVDITIEKDVLTLRADVSATAEVKGALRYAEYGVGRYERSFSLGEEIDREHIEAVVHNGVLRLRLPKAPRSVRKVEVRAL